MVWQIYQTYLLRKPILQTNHILSNPDHHLTHHKKVPCVFVVAQPPSVSSHYSYNFKAITLRNLHKSHSKNLLGSTLYLFVRH